MRNISSIIPQLFLLMALLGATMANAGIIVGDREWLQPKDLVNYSWNDFNAICAGGSCSGLLGGSGPDLTGWQWASANHMGDLFASLSSHPGGITTYQEASLEPAIDFFDRGFAITTSPMQAIEFGISAVLGLTSTLAPSANPYIAGVGISFGFPASLPFGSEFFSDDNFFPADQADFTLGAWLYRPASVDLPATPGLVFLALIGMATLRRRNSS